MKTPLFSNGTEYMCFTELFCDRCVKNKTDEYGMPVEGSCKLEDAMARGEFSKEIEASFIPTGYISRWACPYFQSPDASIQESFIASMRDIDMTAEQWALFFKINPDAAKGEQVAFDV